MLTLDALFEEDAKAAAKPSVHGKWFEIRLTPDPVTGELLNVGVGFIQARTRSFHFKLLESAAVFGCLYGPRGREQFEFLLTTVRQRLTTQGATGSISPHISFGPQRYAAGDSAQAVVDQMYATVVTLARRPAPLDDGRAQAVAGSPRSTEKVRKRVRRAFQMRDQKGFLNYWRDTPVEVRVDDVTHPLDCQIWMGEDLVSSRTFASIVSSCYKDEHYRRSFLTGAYHSLTIARAYAPRARGGFFILAPDDAGSLSALRSTIDNEIDHTTWILGRKFNIRADVDTSIDALKDKALAFAG